ncbi:TetR/AcrR family transcriptional regulator [Actinopolymorpha pittospori]|uniref:AcrR family transcriptional regulator n=1 Tax=Actinopolymorpha pittospori TaxID=648752 RepID=A0A927MRS8_9ACTN|nr:TetR/AcrR family transcriptional regulator [Actinopolymorpha pittospori]MBE1604949.1 AcrR family transcriptional regulator [Actinopolymorpha pittospori]
MPLPDELTGELRPESSPTRSRIVDAAAEVIATRGLAHTTTKEIARAAGYSEATLYKHFRGKDELVFRVMRERLPTGFIETLAELPTRAGKGSVRTQLEDVVRQAVTFFVQSIPMMSALFAEPALLTRHKEALQASGLGPHHANRAVAGYLRAEQRSGRVASGVRPDAAAAMLLGACFQRAFLEHFVGEYAVETSVEKFARDLVRSLMEGARPRADDQAS